MYSRSSAVGVNDQQIALHGLDVGTEQCAQLDRRVAVVGEVITMVQDERADAVDANQCARPLIEDHGGAEHVGDHGGRGEHGPGHRSTSPAAAS